MLGEMGFSTLGGILLRAVLILRVRLFTEDED